MSRAFMMGYIERLAQKQYIERDMGIIETMRQMVCPGVMYSYNNEFPSTRQIHPLNNA